MLFGSIRYSCSSFGIRLSMALFESMQANHARLPGYVDCYVTGEGKVFNNGKEKTPICKKDAAPQIRLQENNRTRTYGLASLVATHFLPNPNSYNKIIFLDGNNRNCCASNLRWVSGKEFSRYSLFRGKPIDEPRSRQKIQEEKRKAGEEKKRKQTKEQEATIQKETLLLPSDPSCQPIPGYPGYFASPSGEVWKGNRKLTPQHYPNKAARVKVKLEGGRLHRQTVARLVALAFLPNPEAYNRVIFLDRNKNNCTPNNLRWVSEFGYRSWYRSESSELLGKPKRRKKPLPSPVEHHPGSQPLAGYDGYFISPEGAVYKGNRIAPLIRSKGRSLKVKLRLGSTVPAVYHTLGVATLVARHFIPNPKQHPYIIFKDRNHHNCCKDNIAWVDGETFMWYCGITQKAEGRKKIVVDREVAVQTAKNPLLQFYYRTGNEYWLIECWKEVEKKLQCCHDWQQIQSECWIYFADRARRFSIAGDPTGLLLCYIRGIRARLKKEISPRLPYRALMQTDESLRITRGEL